MQKMIVTDKTELTIAEGGGIGNVTVITDDWTSLGAVAETLMKPGNLDEVQFTTDGQVTGLYDGLILESPLFSMVDIVGGKIHVAFALREKTDVEKRLDVLETGQADLKVSQEVQDGAIMEMAGLLGGEA